jgi:THO complex subunit 4
MLLPFIVVALLVSNHCAALRWKREGFAQRGGGEGRGRGIGRGRSFGQGRGRGRGRGYYVRKAPLGSSAEQLDKELDNYHSGAMHVD